MLRRCLLRLALPCAGAAERGSLQVSPKVWEKIAAINQKEGFDASRRLRLSIVTGGCYGVSYKFEFDSVADDSEDVLFAAEAGGNERNAQVVVDKMTLTKLRGATLEYLEELKGSAFVVLGNEFVDKSCACGQSILLKK